MLHWFILQMLNERYICLILSETSNMYPQTPNFLPPDCQGGYRPQRVAMNNLVVYNHAHNLSLQRSGNTDGTELLSSLKWGLVVCGNDNDEQGKIGIVQRFWHPKLQHFNIPGQEESLEQLDRQVPPWTTPSLSVFDGHDPSFCCDTATFKTRTIRSSL